MTSPFPFAALLRDAEGRIVQTLGLTPLQLAPHLACATGNWRGAPVRIESRAYRSERIRYARFATVSGQNLDIGNALCLPALDVGLPIFGADLVAIRQDAAMIAADLSPTSRSGSAYAALLTTLTKLHEKHSHLPSGGDLPAWCTDWFSPYPLYTRFPPAVADRAMAAFDAWVSTYVTIATADDLHPPANAVDVQRGYLRAHREDDKGLGMLGKMFGVDWADEYLDTVLFPVVLDCSYG
jgi:phycocyanobilin:ferredoxin oxidoreductase